MEGQLFHPPLYFTFHPDWGGEEEAPLLYRPSSFPLSPSSPSHHLLPALQRNTSSQHSVSAWRHSLSAPGAAECSQYWPEQ